LKSSGLARASSMAFSIFSFEMIGIDLTKKKDKS